VVVLEESYSVSKGLSWVLQSLIDKKGKVSLLVSPVDFKKRLEASQKLFHFVKSAVDNVTHYILVVNIQLVFLDPRERIEMLFIMLLPFFTNNIIPLFKSISIWQQISMLAPSLEVLDAFEALAEALNHAVGVILGTRSHLKPELLDVGDNRLIFNLGRCTLGTLSSWLFFLAFLSFLGLEL